MNTTRIPVNIISGSLGVGKTTAVNHLLKQRPPGEKWAVLVNEYGQIGLDAALMADAAQTGGVEVREVAGGCICCTAGTMFEVSLVLLLQRRPARLLIEPTGLATVSGILDTLARHGVAEAVDVRSIISLVDPTRLDTKDFTVEEEDQIEAADMLLASRSDLASPAQLEAFRTWAGALFPPKQHIGSIEHGRVPLELLDRVNQRPKALDAEAIDHGPQRHKAHSDVTAHEHNHEHSHHHAHDYDHRHSLTPGPSGPIIRQDHTSKLAMTVGWCVWAERVFDSERINRWIVDLANQPGLRRIKAVLHTDKGWCTVNIADDVRESKPSAYRRDSRLELIWSGPSRPTPEVLEEGLLSCLVDT